MIVEWTHPALSDLIEAQAYITRENPKAATEVAQRIWNASQHLADNPEIGRPGLIERTREWTVGNTPYLIVYRIQNDKLEILRVWHTRRNWRQQSTP